MKNMIIRSLFVIFLLQASISSVAVAQTKWISEKYGILFSNKLKKSKLMKI